MAHSWTQNGPVSLPPKSLAYSAGAVLAVLAVVGVGLGFQASLRHSGEPGVEETSTTADDGVQTAKPIVELPPPVTAPDASDNKSDADADADQDKALAAQTAAAQAVQAKPSKSGGDIDQILTSPSEKPPAAAKPPADEAPPPGPPVKSDVPF